MEARRYEARAAEAWNAFNAGAASGHFLFDRRFMDYHSDRFADASLVVEDSGAPVALLPLNRVGEEAWSHQGLTFGGLIQESMGVARMLAALEACAEALKGEGVKTLVYKPLPDIYRARPGDGDLYWLFRRGARLVRREVSAAIDYRARGPVSGRRARGARKAGGAGLAFQRSADWRGYWRLLEGVLAERHGVAPTHSLAEMELLAERFPDEIALFTATRGDELLAGVVMFRSRFVAHAQYIAAGDAGRAAGALDGLFEHLIALHAGACRYFDFGASTTDGGRALNEGLMGQKEEFGAGAVVQDAWCVDL